MPTRPLFILALSAALCAVPFPAARAQAVARSQGVFTDSDKTAHWWYINGAHALIWDDKPFVPVGGQFAARSWAANASDADYAGDVSALETLKAHGVFDIYVQPAKGGLTAVPPARIQKLLDYLDANGFTYGISLNDGPREPLTGYVVRPGAFRKVAPASGDVRFIAADTASALYYTVTAGSADVRDEGEAVPNGDDVRVPAKAGGPGTQTVVILVPERIYAPGSAEIGVPDLWDGFDNYRDSVIALFGAVHPGKGFRFLCDPLPQNLALTPAFAHFIPTSAGFRAEWAAWLGVKYRNPETITRAWGVMDRPLLDLDEASQLIPLWSGGKGIAGFYDAKIKVRLRANTEHSNYWDDLTAFKAASVRGYMDGLAVALKRAVADVPVVYRNAPAGGWNELFAPLASARGFDGLGVVATEHGEDLATRSAAYTLAQAAESPKTVWMPALAMGDSGAATPARAALSGDLDTLRGTGAKGFYLSDVRRLAETNSVTLDYLRDYAAALNADGTRTSASSAGAAMTPAAVFYPRKQLPDLAPTRLSGANGWWLPTNRPGQVYEFGVPGRAYSIEEPGLGTVYYLWNAREKRRIEIAVPKSAMNDKSGSRVAWSENADGALKKATLALTVGPEPIRLVNYPAIPVPTDAFSLAQTEANAFVKAMKAGKQLDYARFQGDMIAVHHDKERDNTYSGVTEVLNELAQVRLANRRYLWIDAEQCPSHNFDEISVLPGASGDRVLRVDARPDATPATAQYKINLGEDKPEAVWVAMSPDALVSLRLDGRPLVDEATLPQKVGARYADGKLVWTRFGVTTLPKGTHTLEVRADGPALIDAILFTRQPFTPDGPNPPPVTP